MTLEDALAEIAKKDASIARLEGKNEDLIGKLKNETARADTAEKESAKVAEAETRATTAETALQGYKAEAALNAALTANNVDSKHVLLILKAHKSDITFDESGEPQIGGKSIEAWGKDYFAKDGHGYVRASENDGGGATGNTSTKTSDLTGKPFSLELYQTRKAVDPAGAAAWATDTGNGYLNNV
ncbi:hypothetical protein QP179_03270 [Sphingomonas aurantiaca]|uniref:hypothetical protein n=1 Tax=Sphingomonas aurantiaca TaxID=185949 RepID=UPI002FE20ADE